MKTLHYKQLLHSANKVITNRLFLWRALFMAVMIIMLGPALYAGFVTGDFTAFYTIVGGGSTVHAFSMGNIGDIDQPSDIETAPNQIGFRLHLTALEQIDDGVPFPTPDANRNIGTIPLKSGEYMHRFDGVKDSLKYVGTAEKGDVTSTFNKTFNIIVKYNAQSLNFCEQYQGKGFILIFLECEANTKELLGSSCKPLYLTNFEIKKDGDGKYISLTFGNDHWRQPLNYTGTIVNQAPVVVPQDATDLAIQSGNNNYLLSDPSAANVAIATFSGIAAADVGRIITVNAPATNAYDNTIADNAAFVLKDGATWTSKPGSSITFEVFDETTLVEIDRIQTA